MISTDQFRARVTGYWVERLGCTLDDLQQPGTTIRHDPAFAGSSEVCIYRLAERVVVRMDPALEPYVDLGHDVRLTERLTMDDLRSHIGLGQTLHLDRTGFFWYLDAAAFRPQILGGWGEVRQLTLPHDIELVHDLCAQCAPEELEEAEIEDERPDDILFGYLIEGQLVAYAGFRYWHNHFADIGVLTDPAFRGRGLGKVLVSRVCRWCILHDIIPMYRAELANEHSWRIAEALGFERTVSADNATMQPGVKVF